MCKGLLAVAFCFLTFICSRAVWADDPDEPKKQPSEDRTGVLYDKIIDYLENMNAVQENRHCVLGKGLKKSINDDEIKDFELIKLLVVEPDKKLRLAATATIVNPLGRRSESWGQALEVEGATIIRNTHPGNPATIDRKFDESTPADKKPMIMVKAITPFDDAVRLPLGIDSVGLWRSGFAESLFMTNALKLEEADYDKDGNIVSKWRNRSAVNTVYIDIVFSKLAGYNPVRSRFYLKRGEHAQLFGDISTLWEMRGKHWLPVKHEAAHFDSDDREIYLIFEYQWKLQDDFEKDLIVVDSNDWREPFRLLFNEEWARPGHGIIRPPEALQVP